MTVWAIPPRNSSLQSSKALMLQIYKSPSVQVGEGESTHDVPYSAQPSLADLFATVIGFIRRQFLVVLSVVLLTIGLAAVYLFTTPPLYSAKAKMMIDTQKVQVLRQSILGDDPFNSVMIDSQIEILKSENFALSIVKNLRPYPVSGIRRVQWRTDRHCKKRNIKRSLYRPKTYRTRSNRYPNLI